MSKKSYLNQGYILLDEEEQSPLRTHDDIPSISGLTQEELTKRVKEGMLPNKEAGWSKFCRSSETIFCKKRFVLEFSKIRIFCLYCLLTF